MFRIGEIAEQSAKIYMSKIYQRLALVCSNFENIESHLCEAKTQSFHSKNPRMPQLSIARIATIFQKVGRKIERVL